MTVEEKINVLVEQYCRNRSHLADMIGVTPQAVNNWVYRNHIPRRSIEAITARFPQVDREWLGGGNTHSSSWAMPLPAEDDEDEAKQYTSPGQGIGPEATYLLSDGKTRDSASALLVTGVQPTLGDAPQAGSRERLAPIQMPRQDVKYVFQCHGDSMLPRIQNGDYVGVGEALGRYEEFRQGDPYLIQTTDGRLMVKMVKDPGPSSPYLLLSTENPNYQLADGGKLAKSEFRAAYRVIMVMRDI